MECFEPQNQKSKANRRIIEYRTAEVKVKQKKRRRKGDRQIILISGQYSVFSNQWVENGNEDEGTTRGQKLGLRADGSGQRSVKKIKRA